MPAFVKPAGVSCFYDRNLRSGFLICVHSAKLKIALPGGMAELADAPDSKSGEVHSS